MLFPVAEGLSWLQPRLCDPPSLSEAPVSVQVSDLLREQFFLRSELGYSSHPSSTRHTSRSPSPILEEAPDREERPGTYRAFVSITPATPPRPNAEEKQPEREEGGTQAAEVGAGAGEEENLQQLIKQVQEDYFNYYIS